MSQASASPSGNTRPLSPHLQIWRWHVTMLGSILHRVTGVGLYIGAFLVTAWLCALAAGPAVYADFVACASSPLGLFVWFGFSLSLFYHLLSGLRHILWDTGMGLTPKTASTLTTASIWLALIVTLLFWAGLFASGKVHL